jgi:hypothetical protein
VTRRYCLISPCRDEQATLRRTLDAVVAQAVQPAKWVIVDDGSTDDTPAILAEYCAKHPWITVVQKPDRGARKVGPGVIEAFYAGYDTIDPTEFDYVCKFDVDLDLPPGYFETLIQRMEAEPRIGTCSGKPYYPPAVLRGDPPPTRDELLQDDQAFDTSGLVSEKCGDEMSVGMIKFYRTSCFTQIGGFVRQVMWDGIDCHRCRQLGWIAVSWDDPELRFVHLRPMGTSHKGIFTGRMRHGFGQWFMGTGLTYMTASAAFRMTRPPYVLGGAAMWWGYVRSALAGEPRLADPQLRRLISRYQWQCLLRGKSAATAELNQRQAEAWQPPPSPQAPEPPAAEPRSAAA